MYLYKPQGYREDLVKTSGAFRDESSDLNLVRDPEGHLRSKAISGPLSLLEIFPDGVHCDVLAGDFECKISSFRGTICMATQVCPVFHGIIIIIK